VKRSHTPAPEAPLRRRLVIAATGTALGWPLAGRAQAQDGAQAQAQAQMQAQIQGGAAGLATPDAAIFRVGPELRAALDRFAGGVVPQEGGVHLDMPDMVENGNAVPVTVRVDSPMTAADHVVAIALFTGRNPLPEVAEFRLGPANGLAQVATRIRLATSQKVVAAARMADGRVRTRHMDVLVTLAACVEG